MDNTFELYNIHDLLKEIWRISAEEERRYEKWEKETRDFPASEREKARTEVLRRKERRLSGLKERLRANLRLLDLPEDLIRRIVRLAERTQEGTTLQNVENEVEKVKDRLVNIAREREVKAKETQQKAKEEGPVAVAPVAVAQAAVIAGVGAAVTAAYNLEKHKRAAEEYVNNKIIPAFVEGSYKERKRPEKPVYPAKQGSQPSKRHKETEEQVENKLSNKAVELLQKNQEAQGRPVDPPEVIKAEIKEMSPNEREALYMTIKEQNPDLAKEIDALRESTKWCEKAGGVIRKYEKLLKEGKTEEAFKDLAKQVPKEFVESVLDYVKDITLIQPQMHEKNPKVREKKAQIYEKLHDAFVEEHRNGVRKLVKKFWAWTKSTVQSLTQNKNSKAENKQAVVGQSTATAKEAPLQKLQEQPVVATAQEPVAQQMPDQNNNLVYKTKLLSKTR